MSIKTLPVLFLLVELLLIPCMLSAFFYDFLRAAEYLTPPVDDLTLPGPFLSFFCEVISCLLTLDPSKTVGYYKLPLLCSRVASSWVTEPKELCLD